VAGRRKKSAEPAAHSGHDNLPAGDEKKALSRYHVEALARALSVLSAFDERAGSMTLGHVSERTGSNPATTLRVISTLRDLGLLSALPESGRYFLSARSVRLGFSAFVNKDLVTVAHPILRDLFRRLGESIYFGMLAGEEAVDVLSFRRNEVVGVFGQRFPLYCTPGGKVALAYCDRGLRRSILRNLTFEPLAPNTPDRQRLEAELEMILAQGYALSIEELSVGIAGAGAPILGPKGELLAYIASSGPTMRMNEDHLRASVVPQIMDAAQRISELVRYAARDTASQ